MACEQFFTTCKRCGKRILMTKNIHNGVWVPCDPLLRKFKPSGGPHTYVTEGGELIRGQSAYDGDHYGYRKHRKDCGNEDHTEYAPSVP